MAKPRANDRQPARELDPQQSRAWLAYMRVSLQMTYEMNHQLVTESELSLSDYHVLSKLHQEPTRKLRIAALAREIGWERSRASHQVRRMTERGLIASEPATDDRRGTVVTVTARGKAAFSGCKARTRRACPRALFLRTPRAFACTAHRGTRGHLRNYS
jgi:DNA-binding MarR family transcriptional regulator